MRNLRPEQVQLPPSGRVPNNRLPVLLYRRVGHEGAAGLEALFAKHDWRNSWRNGIYSFHHFHSITHEVLGLARGSATVHLGGPAGPVVALATGNVVVLPAGTGHKRLDASSDLLVVGAYPGGCDWDIIRADDLSETGYAEAAARIARVPLPAQDPATGREGALLSIWGRVGV